MNKTYISSTSLVKLKNEINDTLRHRYKRLLEHFVYVSGDFATYIQNFTEDITVCKAKYVPDKFHVIRDLRKIVGEKFQESWLYSSEKLADIVKILSESDNIAAPKLKKLIKTKPGIFQTYLSKRYLGCSQEGQNSHVYSVRFGKYANRFLPDTIEKLALIREAIASGCDIELQYKCRELPQKEIVQEIGYDFSEKRNMIST